MAAANKEAQMKDKQHTPTPEEEMARIIERPDGFYWVDASSGKEFGPFASMTEAIEDMEFSADNGAADAESLREAEDSLGITDWIDPDTGELAEDSIHRLED
jgi:hypothetical protein